MFLRLQRAYQARNKLKITKTTSFLWHCPFFKIYVDLLRRVQEGEM
jgi:hypothetical protein